MKWTLSQCAEWKSSFEDMDRALVTQWLFEDIPRHFVFTWGLTPKFLEVRSEDFQRRFHENVFKRSTSNHVGKHHCAHVFLIVFFYGPFNGESLVIGLLKWSTNLFDQQPDRSLKRQNTDFVYFELLYSCLMSSLQKGMVAEPLLRNYVHNPGLLPWDDHPPRSFFNPFYTLYTL